MRRWRKRGRSLGILVGCVLVASIGALPPFASADEPKPAPPPLPSTGSKPAPPPAPTTAPAPSPAIEPTLEQPTVSDSGSTGSEAGATGSDGSAPTTTEEPAGAAGNDPVAGDGTPGSRDLFDVDDVFGIGSPWIDSLSTILEDLASAGRSITADDVPCVVGTCEVPGGSGLGTIIGLAGILAGLLVISAATVRRSGWIVRHR